MDASSREIFYSLFYAVFSACIIYPPVEYISAGVTIPMLFSYFMGYEIQEFIQYHIRRTCITLFIYASLPFGYYFGLWFFGYREINLTWYMETSRFNQVFFTLGIILPIAALCLIKYWSRENWKYHPIVNNIIKLCGDGCDWMHIVSEINREYRRRSTVRLDSNAVCKIVVTDNWIMKVMPLSIRVALQTDATLQVIHTDKHYTNNTFDAIQFINIEVKSLRRGVDPFIIRLNAENFKDFQDCIPRTITVLPHVSFQKTLLERFVHAFKENVAENPQFATDEVLETCIGCLQAQANVKLQKCCVNNNQDTDPCTFCYCKPLWCVDCIAKWFALRQDQNRHDTWFSSKGTCPMCRAKFCLLDVCYIDEEFS